MNSMLGGWRHAFVSLACAALAAAIGSARAAPPPVEHFTDRAAIDSVKLSPSGERMAFVFAGPDGRRKLAVMPLAPLAKPRIIANYSDADVASVHWVNEDRLVFDVHRRAARLYEGDAGTFAVNHDGSQQRVLIAFQSALQRTAPTIELRVLTFGWSVHSMIGDGSDDIFVVKQQRTERGELTGLQLARLNTTNGLLKSESHEVPHGTRHWLVDAAREPRVVTTYVDGRVKAFWRDPASRAWIEIDNYDGVEGGEFYPLWIEPDGSVIVSARGRNDTSGLYRFDPATRKLGAEPLVAVKGFDLVPALESDGAGRALLGIHFAADRPMSAWFDARLDKIQRSIDAALPVDRNNRLYCGRCASSRFFVVLSRSDREPGQYLLYDAERTALEPIGALRPWIDAAKQGTRSFHRVAARDGLSIPLYATHPPGASATEALPAVLLVHGGPWVRGAHLGWQAEAQFLASRGYRVLQPEFRGSTGYGDKLFRAGFRQWGAAMQDDLADVLAWAVKQGGVDAGRVCIMGSSYGGYAALMAPISHPGAFRCAVAFAAVADLHLLYSADWSDISEASKRYSMPVLIGDPVKDQKRLAGASPLLRAGEIKVPVLLGHGDLDRRVPMAHAKQFLRAAREGGVSVQYVEYPDEGHGFALPANEADWLRRVEGFLARSLERGR